MSHLISIELDSNIAKGLLEQFGQLPQGYYEHALCEAIVAALECDDAEEE